MAYREIGISIRSAYSQGWPDDAARLAFRAETRKLFRNAGWQVEEMPLDSGHCDTVRNGKDALYLHPTVFSGVCRKIILQRCSGFWMKQIPFAPWRHGCSGNVLT